jgi:hypothetical protein
MRSREPQPVLLAFLGMGCLLGAASCAIFTSGVYWHVPTGAADTAVATLNVSRPLQIDTIDGEPFHENIDWNQDSVNSQFRLSLKVPPGKHKVAWRCVATAEASDYLEKGYAVRWANLTQARGQFEFDGQAGATFALSAQQDCAAVSAPLVLDPAAKSEGKLCSCWRPPVMDPKTFQTKSFRPFFFKDDRCKDLGWIKGGSVPKGDMDVDGNPDWLRSAPADTGMNGLCLFTEGASREKGK